MKKSSIDSFLKPIEILIQLISRGAFWIAMVVLLVMMAVTGYSVFMRYVVRNPILGTMELIESMMVIVIFFAIPWVTLKKEQMSLSALVKKFNPMLQKIMNIFTKLLTIIMFFLIAWRQTTEAQYSFMLHEKSDLLNIPRFPLYYTIAFGVGMLCLIFCLNLLRIFIPKKEEVALEQ